MILLVSLYSYYLRRVPDSKVQGANMRPGVGPTNLAIRGPFCIFLGRVHRPAADEPRYSRRTRSLPWLLLVSPGHHQPWFLSLKKFASLVSTRMNPDYLRHRSVFLFVAFLQMQIYLCWNTFSAERLRSRLKTRQRLLSHRSSTLRKHTTK